MVKPKKKSALPRGIADPLVRRRDMYHWEAAPDAKATLIATVSQKILGAVRKLARDDSKSPLLAVILGQIC
jgi:hypothetical protein